MRRSMLVLVVLLITIPMTLAQASTAATTGLWGVHVCTGKHYNRLTLLCVDNDGTIAVSAYPAARLSITGRAGHNFTSNTLTVLLQQRTADGDVELGRTTLDVGLSDNVTALPLSRLFAALGVQPFQGTAYRVEADATAGSTQVLLGVVTFTLQPAALPGAVPAGGQPLVIIKQYGAALRSYPSSDAPIETTLGCGTQLHSFDLSKGWYHVQTRTGATGWVGGVRAAPVNANPIYDCSNAITYQVGTRVMTHVASGCLSLRSFPSRQAAYAHCVSNGHLYVIINGPITIAGEDWFGVYSPSTGSGWSLAQYLFRV